jgi:hypothetical protein
MEGGTTVDFADTLGVGPEVNEAEQPLKSGRAAIGAVLNSITMVDTLKVRCSARYFEYLRAGLSFKHLPNGFASQS